MNTTAPIVVAGGGFAGVYATQKLLKKGQHVVMVSPSNYFTFTPLLHEVATGSLGSHDISFDYETFFSSDRFEFIRGKIGGINPQQKTIRVEGEDIAYSGLILATGSKTNFFGMPGVKYAHVLKTVQDAINLKEAIIAKAQGPHKKVTITVVGGGPTGLELLFELRQMLDDLQKKHEQADYHLRMVHGAEVFCEHTDKRIQDYIMRAVKGMQAELVLGAYAQEITSSHVITSAGDFASDVTVMCAGVKPNTKYVGVSVDQDEHGHVLVDRHLQTSDPNIFAVGDIISFSESRIPKLAQTAVRQAPIAVENLLGRLEGSKKPLRVYNPKTVGMLFSMGFGNGVGIIHNVIVKGVFAWWLWRTVYLFKIPGLWNKLRVAFGWTLDLFQGRNLTEL